MFMRTQNIKIERIIKQHFKLELLYLQRRSNAALKLQPYLRPLFALSAPASVVASQYVYANRKYQNRRDHKITTY